MLLLAGVGVIYLASLLQDESYPHPAKIRTSDRIHYAGPGPDTILLSVQPKYLYQTMIYFGQGHRNQIVSGTGDMKTGVYVRKPIQYLLQHQNESAAGDEWTTLWEHTIDGPITKISGPPSTNHSTLQFAVLYHTVEDESTRYYVRVYYISNENESFEYKTLILPGTTWIKSFVLESNCILLQRDPDTYQYRIIDLPRQLTEAPHSMNSKEIILSSSKPGYQVSSMNRFMDQVEKHENVISQLYSPAEDTLRVISLDIYKARSNFYVTAFLTDNASTVTQLSTLRDETPVSTWHLRNYQMAEDNYNEDDYFRDNGVLDIPRMNDNRVRMPAVTLSRSTDAKTVAFPIKRTQFMTVDYMDNVDILIEQNNKQKDWLYRNSEGVVIPEYYYWPLDEYKEVYDVYDGDILGLKVNSDGTLLAVWTENNFIYIYKRGTGDDHVIQDDEQQEDDDDSIKNDDAQGTKKYPHSTTTTLPIKSLSLIDHLDVLLGLRLALPSTTQAKQHPDLPPRWYLRMVITPHDKSSRQARIDTVDFVNAISSPYEHAGNNYLLVASTASVQSYMIDTMEPPQELGLGSFITGQWDMLIAMCVIIAAFVFNEYHHYGHL
ncbi:unnamed protein product [Absidia cylindrospora]